MQQNIEYVHQYYRHEVGRCVANGLQNEGVAPKEHIIRVDGEVDDVHGNRENQHRHGRNRKLGKGVNSLELQVAANEDNQRSKQHHSVAEHGERTREGDD